jgi:hypothetical protein
MNTQFLDSVLGENGSLAIQRAIEKNPSFNNILVPRVLLSWINNISNYGFEGKVPGTNETFLVLEKTENGLDGAVTIDEKLFTFNNSSLIHVAAAIGVALNSKISGNEDFNEKDLEVLGKNIDILVKTTLIKNIQEQYLSQLDYGDFVIEYTGILTSPYLVKHEPTNKVVATDLLKIEDAKKIAQLAQEKLSKYQESAAEYKYRKQHPHQPHADHRYDHKKKSKFTPKIPKGPTKPRLTPRRHLKPRKAKLKMSEEDMGKVCSECGGNIFKSEEFVGCVCLSYLSQYIKLEKTQSGNYLNFSEELPEEDIEAVYEIIEGF